MKLGKLSLIAALALSTGLHAFETVKVSGQAKLWYQTMDHEGGSKIAGGVKDKGLFQLDKGQGNEWGNFSAEINVNGEVNDHISYGVSLMAVTTLGLDGHLLGAETSRGGMAGGGSSVTGDVGGTAAQPFWVHQVFVDYTKGDNHFKVGRMELDTPLAFTEKWNATANSFEAALAVNTSLPDTTLIAAWVAKGNGTNDQLITTPQVWGNQQQFTGYMGYDGINSGGALVVGAVNKSLGLPIQAWVYEIPHVGSAYWIQADASAKDLGPVSKASLQLISGGIGTKSKTQGIVKTLGDTKDTHALAAKVGASIAGVNMMAAFSSTTEGNLPVANTATNYKKTKLPTQLIFNDGMVVAQPDTTAWKIAADTSFDGIGKFTVAYGSAKVGKNGNYVNPTQNGITMPGTVAGPASMGAIAQWIGEDQTVNEFDFVYNTKVADVDIAAMYIRLNQTYVPIIGSKAGQGDYGTYANDVVRIVATLKF